jgi:hypothetical protein
MAYRDTVAKSSKLAKPPTQIVRLSNVGDLCSINPVHLQSVSWKRRIASFEPPPAAWNPIYRLTTLEQHNIDAGFRRGSGNCFQ